MKYIYNNKIHKIEIDTDLEIFLQVDKGMISPLNTLIPTSNIESIKESKQEVDLMLKLLGDDQGSLDFTKDSK